MRWPCVCEVHMQLNLSNIHYTYAGSPREVLHGVTLSLPTGWTGIIGDNGCGKSTLARIAAGLLRPTAGSVGPAGLVAAYCEQDSALAPAALLDFAAAWDRDALRLRDALGIGDNWAWRFDELSSGQQKRLQVAVALWSRPDVLVMDEPTNHLDAPTRKAVLLALRSFNGVGILISHDRDLLDALVGRCVSFEGGEVRLRPGGYTQASEQREREVAAAVGAQARARREERRLVAERQRRVEAASRADGLRSRRGLDPHDHDTREKIGRAIVSGKDGRATHLATALDARIQGQCDRARASFVERRYDGDVPALGERSRRAVIARLDAGLVRYGGDEEAPGVLIPDLLLGSADHVGVVGPNGSGKSTLVRALVAAVPEDVPMLFVPQELDEAAATRAHSRLQTLGAAEKGRVLSVVAQLNSRPEAMLEGGELSPGELRKLVLAEAILGTPQLLVMDEPTNHLDLHSIEALERLLARFPGAVILVSHDARVVRSSCKRIWELHPANGDDFSAGARLFERLVGD